jgi:dihydrofolate reductase
MPDFDPGRSYGFQEFLADCDAVVMGRTTFAPALGAPSWPWPGLDAYVLTSTPLPPETPSSGVIASDGGPVGLLEQLRARGGESDVHLVGGPRTIRAFYELGALDRLEVLVLPYLAGAGLPLSPVGSPPMKLDLIRSDRSYPDGTVEAQYAPQ